MPNNDSINQSHKNTARGEAGLRVRRSRGKFSEYRGFVLLLAGLLFLYLIGPFLIPLALGIVFAIVLYPFFEQMGVWRLSKGLKALLVTILFTIVFLIPVALVIFKGAASVVQRLQVAEFTSGDPGSYLEGLLEVFGLSAIVEGLIDYLPISAAQASQILDEFARMAGSALVVLAQQVLADVPRAIVSMLIILITIYYCLVDGSRALRFIRSNSFFNPSNTDKIFNAVEMTCHSVINASIVSGLVQAGLLSIVVVATGTGGVFILFLVTFIASFLPMIGTAPVSIGLILHNVAQGDYVKAVVFAVIGVVIGVSDNFVRPYVIKGGSRMHPLIAFVSAFGALDVIGVAGLFLGPIVAGIFMNMLPIITESYELQSSRDGSMPVTSSASAGVAGERPIDSSQPQYRSQAKTRPGGSERGPGRRRRGPSSEPSPST